MTEAENKEVEKLNKKIESLAYFSTASIFIVIIVLFLLLAY